MAAQEPKRFALIDASPDAEEVHGEVRDALVQRLGVTL